MQRFRQVIVRVDSLCFRMIYLSVYISYILIYIKKTHATTFTSILFNDFLCRITSRMSKINLKLFLFGKLSSIITWLISSQRQLLYGVGLCSNRHRADLEVSLQYQIHRTAITYEIYKFFYSLLFSKFMYNSCYITCSSLWFFFYTVKGKNNVCIFNPFKFMLACKL